MPDALNGKPPTSFYIIATVFIVWNLIGLMFYYQQMTLTPEMMAEYMTDAQIVIVTGTPEWATAGYAIAVNAGLVGAILLLLRKRWAAPFFIASLLGALVQDLDAFILRDVIGAWGSSALYLPAIVIVMCIVEIGYSRSAQAKGLLT